MFYEFEGFKPVAHPGSFVHPQATVIGNVLIGDKVYIGPGAVLRGDWGRIVLHDGVNVQENCVVHMFPGVEVVLEEQAHIGHGAIVHGARIGRNALIGMLSVVMDEAVVGAESIVGALSFIKAKMIIPERSLVVGNPAEIIRSVDDRTLAWKTQGTELYMQLPEQARRSLKPCEPLTEEEPNRPAQPKNYFPKGS
ncbi:gamma carbonic anhydrase family protein [bacterium]|nr:gamma carbonic anhydrase family protein [bacterium]